MVAPMPELDNLHTPVALFDLQGRYQHGNLAFSVWCAGSHASLEEVFPDLPLSTLLARLERGEQILRRQASSVGGRDFPAEFLLRRVVLKGFGGILLEGRDASRTAQNEAMLKSFSKVIEESNRKLRTQTAELSGLLDGLQQAVFAVNSDLRIAAPVSRHALHVFGCDVEDAPILDTLFRHAETGGDVHARVMSVLLTVFGADELQWDLLVEALPARVPYHRPSAPGANNARMLDVAYSPIWNADGLLDRIIFAVTDVTEKLALQRTVEQERRNNQLALRRLEQLAYCDPTALELFFRGAAAALRQIVHALETGASTEAVEETLRQAHTVKGNARVLGLSDVVDCAHHVESSVMRLRMPATQEPPDILIRAAVLELQRDLHGYSRLARQVFRIDDAFAREGALELDRICEHLAVLAWRHDAGVAGLAPELRRVLQEASLVADVLEDAALAEAIAATADLAALAEECGSPAREGAAMLSRSAALQRLFVCALPHVSLLADDPRQGVTPELVADLNRLANQVLARRGSAFGILAHGNAARAEMRGVRWLLAGYRQLEALLVDDPLLEKMEPVQAVLAFLYSRLALDLASHLAYGGDAHDGDGDGGDADAALSGRPSLHGLLDMASHGAGMQSMTLATMARVWDVSLASVAGDVLSLAAPRDWGATAMHIAMRDVDLRDALRTLDEADIADSGCGRLLRRFIELGFELPTYAVRLELARVSRRGSMQAQRAMPGARRMRQVPHRALSAIEYLLQAPDLALEPLADACRHLLATPAEIVVGALAPMVDDLALSLKKRVRMEVACGEVSFSAAQAGAVGEMLMHLLRNAIGHGIENPVQREHAGKNPVGRISVDISSRGHELLVSIADDGRGIDVALVKAAARAAYAPQYRDDLSAEEALMLVLVPGVSTAPQVTPLSGRGIGMSVVAENVRRLSGTLSIESNPGQGTRIRIVVPGTEANLVACSHPLPIRSSNDDL